MKGLLIFVSTLITLSSCAKIKGINKEAISKKAKTITKGSSTLTNQEVVNGLKEALTMGAVKSSTLAGAVNGFYKNPRLYIPWPEEATEMKNKLIKLGFSKKIDEFEMSLNRAAEEAATHATPILQRQ